MSIIAPRDQNRSGTWVHTSWGDNKWPITIWRKRVFFFFFFYPCVRIYQSGFLNTSLISSKNLFHKYWLEITRIFVTCYFCELNYFKLYYDRLHIGYMYGLLNVLLNKLEYNWLYVKCVIYIFVYKLLDNLIWGKRLFFQNSWENLVILFMLFRNFILLSRRFIHIVIK